jgi:hypothetical protein
VCSCVVAERHAHALLPELTLVSAPQLARSHQHLKPLGAFVERQLKPDAE